MGWHWCRFCDGRGVHGWIPRWLWLARLIRGTRLEQYIAVDCGGCGGDGKMKPPGWPEQSEMDRLHPSGVSPSPPPPPKR